MRLLWTALMLIGLGLFVPIAAPAKEFIVHDEPVLLLENANLIDGTGSPIARQQSILLRDGAIAAVGPVSDIFAPQGAVRLDLSGQTVIPGLVMMHEHMFYPTGKRNYTEMVYTFPRLYLAGGTTTVRTAGSMGPVADLNLRRAVEQGDIIGPDMNVTAPYLNGPGLPILKVRALRSPQDAARMVHFWADEGVESYKAYMQISREELGAVVRNAHARGKKVTGHLCSVTFREAADLGIDNLEHGFIVATDFVEDKEPDQCPSRQSTRDSLLALDPQSDAAQSLIAHLVAANVAITSTLTVFETGAKGRPKAYDRALDMLLPQLKASYLERWQEIADGDDDAGARLLAFEMAMERAFVAAGGTLLAGTDPTGFGGVVAGFSNKRQLELMVEAGFPVEEAIGMASLNGARFLGQQHLIGSVEPGKRANLAVIDGDPTENLEDIRNIPLVFKDGVGYSSDAIFEAMAGQVGLH